MRVKDLKVGSLYVNPDYIGARPILLLKIEELHGICYPHSTYKKEKSYKIHYLAGSEIVYPIVYEHDILHLIEL